MHPLHTIAYAATVAAIWAAPASADIIFVRANQTLPTALQTGSSWLSAFKDLQAALAVASSGDQVWVAKGIYKPTSGAFRTATFSVPTDVAILGGFAGVETLAVQRDVLANPTTLSGEIGAPGLADNCFHVVTTGNATDSNPPVIDGFRIVAGNANGPANLDQHTGAAVFSKNGATYIASCIVRDNSATEGIIASDGPGASAVDRNLHIVTSLVIGNDGTAVTVTDGRTARLLSCTIANNTAGVHLIGPTSEESTVANCIIALNGSGSEAEQLTIDAGQELPLLFVSIVQGWDNVAPSGESVLDVDPRFRDPDGDDDVLGTPDDNFELRGDSPAIDAGTALLGERDMGDVDSDGVTFLQHYPHDVAGRARKINDPLVPSVGGQNLDLGAFEYHRPLTLFVDASATGNNSGTSWANAFTDLQDAIAVLDDPDTGTFGEIWVANGTYRPTSGSDTTVAFAPLGNMAIYGGFAGGELDRSLRDWPVNQTVLSGDLLPPGASNSRHVLHFDGSSNTNIVLDGFIVRDGAANASGGPGGGIAITNDAAPVIRNCFITANQSPLGVGGAGVFMGGTGSGVPQLVQCIVANNGTASSGGAGAGVLVSNPSARISNCVIVANDGTSSSTAAGIHVTATGTAPQVKNCILFDNTAGGLQSGSAQIRSASSGPSLQVNCSAIEGFGSGLPSATTLNCFSFDEDFVIDARGADNLSGTMDDDYRPLPCSPLIDSGDRALLPTDTGDLDSDGNSGEILSQDYGRRPRRVNMPVPDSGPGSGLPIDIGLFELAPTDLPSPDFNHDGVVDATDLAMLLGSWSQADSPLDLDGDCVIGGGDLATLLGQWS